MRLLKMGNTYREARNYDLAQKNINEGIERATRSGNRYWQATGYEYLGLVYRDMGDRQAALAALQRASDIFNDIIKSRSPQSSRNSTQMLLDNMMSDDASRLQPMPASRGDAALNANTSTSLNPNTRRTAPPTSSVPPQNLRPRDLPPRSAPPASSNAPSRTPSLSPLEQERALNAQLTARLAALEERIKNLDNVQPSAGASASRSPVGTTTAPTTSSNPPGGIARTMPQRSTGDKPQGEFAPYQTDKKPVPPPPAIKRDTARAVVKDTALPIFTLRVGIGAGFALNRPIMGIPATIIAPSTFPTGFTGGSGDVSFPMLSISGDFYVSPQFSLGLMYGYFPGPNINDTTRITTGTGIQTTTTTTTRIRYTDYHFLTVRPAYHFVRNQTLDAYVGLPIGTMLSNFTPVRLYVGLLGGFQYNFTRQVGVFLELSAGGHYTGRNGTEPPIDPGAIPGLTIDGGIVNIGAFGRLGLAVNF